MKILKLAIGIALTSTIMWSCKNETEPQVKTVEIEETASVNKIDENAILAKAEFNIEGMTCAIGCAKTIEKKLSKMEGVKSATVDFDKKLAMVEYDEAKVTPTSLEKIVTDASDTYSVSEMKTVESFTTDGAKKGCDKDCKKACCAGKDKKECKTKCSEDCTDKDCEKCAALKAECKKACDAKKASCKDKDKKECKGKDKAECKGKDKKACDAKKAACKGKDKKECKSKKA